MADNFPKTIVTIVPTSSKIRNKRKYVNMLKNIKSVSKKYIGIFFKTEHLNFW